MTTTIPEGRSIAFSVAPVTVCFEGIVTPDGAVISVELAQPRRRWAVFATSTLGTEILSMSDSEVEARKSCDYVRGRLIGADGPILVASNDEGGRLQ